MSNILHTFYFMHDLSIYEIKRICHHAQYYIISYILFHPLNNFFFEELKE